MPKSPVKITRTRTAASKTRALKFKDALEEMREVEERLQKLNDDDFATSRARKGKGKPIGGGPLGGDVTTDDGPSSSTADKGFTVEPIRKDVGQQVQRCSLCDGLGHQEQLCILDTSSRPPAITCKQCSHSYKYTDGDQKLLVEVQLCSAHKKAITEKPSTSRDADKKKHAEFVLERVKELTADGTPLESALEWLQVTRRRYERFQRRLA